MLTNTGTVDVQAILEQVTNFLLKALPVAGKFLFDMIWIVVILVVGFKLIGYAIKWLRHFLERSPVEAGVVTFLCSFSKYGLYFVLALIVLAEFGVEPGSVVAILGSAGLAIGLALQGSLSNLAGGVLILLLKPFRVGDYIIEKNTGQEGTVKEIGIIYTKLATIENKAIMIPNGNLANTSIINLSMMKTRRVEVIVGISYHSDIATAKSVLREVAQKDEACLTNEPIDVFVAELADSCVKIGVRMWVESPDYWTTLWRMTENVKLALDENGIEIPFPQLEVEIKK